MAKTYTLSGPLQLQNMSAADALGFCGAVINAIPSYSMGTASLHLRAEGPASTPPQQISGTSLDALKAALANAERAFGKDPADITYDVIGCVALIGLSLEDGIQVIEATMNAIPEDALVVTALIAQQTAPN